VRHCLVEVRVLSPTPAKPGVIATSGFLPSTAGMLGLQPNCNPNRPNGCLRPCYLNTSATVSAASRSIPEARCVYWRGYLKRPFDAADTGPALSVSRRGVCVPDDSQRSEVCLCPRAAEP
jgi:hypothetical protein